MVHWSSGYDTALSRREREFDFLMDYQIFPLDRGIISGRLCVFFKFRRDDVIASHSGLKIRWSKDREGWSPSRATTFAAMRAVVTKT